MRRVDQAIAIVILLVIGHGPALAGAPPADPSGKNSGAAAVAAAGRPLPFDPMTLPAPPPELVEQLKEQRWWAAAFTQMIVACRIVDAKRSAWMTDTAQTLMEESAVNWDLGVVREPNLHLRLQMAERGGRPNAAVIFLW